MKFVVDKKFFEKVDNAINEFIIKDSPPNF